MKNYYEELHVSSNASKEEIKKAYIKLAKKYHPDRAKGIPKEIAERYMKDINEAYDVLSDDDKRKEYDLKRNPPVTKMPKKQEDNFSYSKNKNTEPLDEFEWIYRGDNSGDIKYKINCYLNARKILLKKQASTKELDEVLMKLHILQGEQTGNYFEALMFANESQNIKYRILLYLRLFGMFLYRIYTYEPRIMIIVFLAILYTFSSSIYGFLVKPFVPAKKIPKPQIVIQQQQNGKKVSDIDHIACLKAYFRKLQYGTEKEEVSPLFFVKVNFDDINNSLQNWTTCTVDVKEVIPNGDRREILFTINGTKDVTVNNKTTSRKVKIEGGAETIVYEGNVKLNTLYFLRDLSAEL